MSRHTGEVKVLANRGQIHRDETDDGAEREYPQPVRNRSGTHPTAPPLRGSLCFGGGVAMLRIQVREKFRRQDVIAPKAKEEASCARQRRYTASRYG